MLLNSEFLKKNYHSTISKLFDSSTVLLWMTGGQYGNTHFFVCDTISYKQVKAGIFH